MIQFGFSLPTSKFSPRPNRLFQFSPSMYTNYYRPNPSLNFLSACIQTAIDQNLFQPQGNSRAVPHLIRYAQPNSWAYPHHASTARLFHLSPLLLVSYPQNFPATSACTLRSFAPAMLEQKKPRRTAPGLF